MTRTIIVAIAALVLSTSAMAGALCRAWEMQKEMFSTMPSTSDIRVSLINAKWNCKRELERERLAKLPPVKFGMSQAEVLETNLGVPNRKMTSLEGENTIVKFIYDGDKFVVLTNDKVTAIQE